MYKFSVFVLCTAFLCTCVSSASKEEVYSNSWAVEVKGGHHIADALAKKHGFTNKGIVGSLDNVYHFVHEESPFRERRSVDTLHHKHAHLVAEEHVSYVEQQVIKSRVKRDLYTTPIDRRWSSQWYLHRASGHDMNIERVWEQDIIGRGSVVSILDDGIEHTHPDLKKNYDPLASYDFNNHDADPFPRYDYTNENKHGTRCAGEVAANRNGICGVGAAYGAKIGGVRMLDGDVTDVVEASSLSLNPQHIDIYSSSWGPNDDGATIDGPGPLARKAFLDGITKGRGGLGSLFLWAAGNGGRYGDSCNCDGYAVSPYTISVGSASERDERPWYLEECSSTLASTYSSGASSEQQIVSTDLHGQCTPHHTGTSAAAPLAAGIIALALEANGNLTWRDMQYLLVHTSNPHYPHDNHWITNGVGLKVSHLYGFGIIDATALVNRARNWITVPPRINCTVNLTQTLKPNSISQTNSPIVIKAIFGSDCPVSYIEHTQAFVTLKLLSGQRKNVQITLTSPQGTQSILLPYRRADRHMDGIHNWPFMTVMAWGESPIGGEWTFVVTTKQGTRAQLLGLELVVHGTHGTPRALRDVPAECDPQCKGGCSRTGPESCDDCKNFRLFSTLECVEKCPQGTFQNHHMCIQCPELCAECSDQNNCVQCKDGAVRLDTGLCAAGCPSPTFLAPDHTCKVCHSSCLSCEGPTEKDCLSCPGQLSLQDGKCLLRSSESCEQGQYFDHRALECRSCHISCENCTGKDSDQCTSCYGNYTLSDKGRCIGTVECEHREYYDRENFQCSSCPEKCTSCSSNSTCTLCDKPHYLTTTGLCVEKCPERTATNNKTRTCLDTSCSEHCLTCFGASEDSCASCEDGALLLGSSCVTQCPEHTYMADSKTCRHCDDSCRTCNGSLVDNCLSCPEGSYLHQRQCISTCPEGTASTVDGTCLPCPSNCAQCSPAGICNMCKNNLLRLASDNSCIEKCPEGFVMHKASQSCQPCGPHCLKCTNPTTCQKCEENFVYYAPNRSCRSHCPDGYFLSPDKASCLECRHPCSTCEGSATNCLACGTNMAFDKSDGVCRACCNSDKAVALPCCDCDSSTSECVKQFSIKRPETVPSLSESSFSTHVAAVGLVLVAVIAAVMIGVVLFLFFVRKKRLEHTGAKQKYQTLGSSKGPLEVVDDSGSEAEIFSRGNKRSRGYTSVHTIDHDAIAEQDVI